MVKVRGTAARLPARSLARRAPSVRPRSYLPERMFPSLLLRGIDLAVEFATLGEYGLEPAPWRNSRGSGPDLAGFPQVDLSGIGGASVVEPPASRRNLRASTFAARSRVPDRHVLPSRPRRRPGAAPARPQ